MFASGPVQELAHFVTAAGGVKPSRGENIQFTVSPFPLKRRNGSTFDAQGLTVSDALLDSFATYLAPPDSSKRIVYISSSMNLRSLLCNNSAGWTTDEAFEPYRVHASGKLAGAVSADGDQHIFFQDPSGKLVHLDNDWAPTVLSLNVATGSPLSVLSINDTLHLFYTSDDNHIYYLAQRNNGTWVGARFTNFTFGTDEKPKRFIASLDASNALEVFVLTERKTIFRISAHGERTTLSVIDNAGKWTPTTKEECFLIFALRGWVHYDSPDVCQRPKPRASLPRASLPTTKSRHSIGQQVTQHSLKFPLVTPNPSLHALKL